jgi:adenylate cyclase class IV
MRNLEFKAELRHPAAARQQCRALGAERLGRVAQIDTYFKLTDGRLKRREAPGEPVEWIYYHRPDVASPRVSDYSILSDDQARRRWGTHSLRPWLVVAKTRELWMIENVRIHLDEVEQLGSFIEFEAMVDDHHDLSACQALLARLREAFSATMGEPISASYSDLAAQAPAKPPLE